MSEHKTIKEKVSNSRSVNTMLRALSFSENGTMFIVSLEDINWADPIRELVSEALNNPDGQFAREKKVEVKTYTIERPFVGSHETEAELVRFFHEMKEGAQEVYVIDGSKMEEAMEQEILTQYTAAMNMYRDRLASSGIGTIFLIPERSYMALSNRSDLTSVSLPVPCKDTKEDYL